MNNAESIQSFDHRHCNGESLDQPLQQSNHKEDGYPGLRLLEFRLFTSTTENNKTQGPSDPPLPPAMVDDSSGTSDTQILIIEQQPISIPLPKTIPIPHTILPVASLIEVVNKNIGKGIVCKKMQLTVRLLSKSGSHF